MLFSNSLSLTFHVSFQLFILTLHTSFQHSQSYLVCIFPTLSVLPYMRLSNFLSLTLRASFQLSQHLACIFPTLSVLPCMRLSNSLSLTLHASFQLSQSYLACIFPTLSVLPCMCLSSDGYTFVYFLLRYHYHYIVSNNHYKQTPTVICL
jgi:hypothetical protein